MRSRINLRSKAEGDQSDGSFVITSNTMALWSDGVEVGISAFGVVREAQRTVCLETRERDRKRTG